MTILLLAEGFEELEALTPVDVLRRNGVEIKTVSITNQKQITGAHGITVTADTLAQELSLADVDALILPGGMPGTVNLDESSFTDRAITAVTACGGVIGAICAAPSILGKRGLLDGKRAVCFPGFEDKLSGATVVDAPVVQDGNTVTARDYRASIEFADTLTALIKGTGTR